MPEKKSNFLSILIFTLYLMSLISVILSFRAISSISIPLLLIAGMARNKVQYGSFFRPALINPLFVSCCLFFLLQLISLAHTSDLQQGARNIFSKTALIAIPAFIFCCDYLNTGVRNKILKWYCVALCAACLFAIFHAFQNYAVSHNFSVFLYHSLVSVYSRHAIQFSILVSIALVHLIETLKTKQWLFSRSVHLSLIVFFTLFLILLSSKLVIVFFIVYVIAVLFRSFRSISRAWFFSSITGLVVIAAFILIIPNPISNRFQEIIQTDFNFLERQKFDPGEYFNGLQFRMLQWRFVPQILTEKKAWITGVSVGDAQALLDQKYIAANMYIGSPGRHDKGLIGYNTHNEFLEALLQTGIPGLVAFMLITAAFIRMILIRKDSELTAVTILLLIYSVSESVFETQYSLYIYLFFPLFFYPGEKATRQ